MVILPDVRGCTTSTRGVGPSSAGEHDAVAIDYFGRTAMRWRGDEFAYKEHVPRTTLKGVTADTSAAVGHLRDQDANRPIFTSASALEDPPWHQAAAVSHLRCHQFLWEPVTTAEGANGRSERFRVSLLALMAGDDPGISNEVVEGFRQAMDNSGVENEACVYSDAPTHSSTDSRTGSRGSRRMRGAGSSSSLLSTAAKA